MSRRKGKNCDAPTYNARGGRPRLEDADRRDRRIGVPVNEQEDEAIDEKSKRAHMKKSVFLRHLGLGKHLHRSVPAINYRAYRQLGRLAAGFSLILMQLDEGKNVSIDQQLITQILDEIRRTQDLLLEGK